MELSELKMSVYQANMALKESGLVISTFGNVSGVDRQRDLLVIKPSGVPTRLRRMIWFACLLKPAR